ncbi:MAG: ROK family protein, partial [Acidobacteria bacterium]|nr:ROK family protein [Acidobacteriota bacterium]MCA1607876.1 ROK family protein [Acidobacteriota bacterium]
MSEMQKAQRQIGVELSMLGLKAVSLEDGKFTGEVHTEQLNQTEATIRRLVEFVKSLVPKFGAFERFGLAIPGLVDRTTGRVAYSSNFPEHTETDVAAVLAAEIGITPVIENDANAAAYAEYVLGAGRGSNNLFYAMLGHGIGGAFIFDGKIWRGASGFAGELGYIAVNSDGTRLEEMASADNIVRRTRSRFNRDSTSSLSKLD